MTSYPLECILFLPSVHGHKQSQVSSTACCMCTLILSQWGQRSWPSILRWYTISTVSPWTKTEPGVLRPHAIWLCILSSSVNGNHHDQQSLDCILFPPSVCGHVQQKAVLAHCMFLSPVYIWKHPWPVTLWLLFPTSGYGHNYSEQCGFGLHISPVYNYMEKPMTSYLLSTASNLRLWTSLFRATRPWFACS